MEIKPKDKIYRLTGIDSAMEMLRPGAKWEITNSAFTRWEDDRPCPSMEEVKDVQKKAREFEDSINTIWTKDQENEILKMQGKIGGALN
jgi:hypothetical protein|tara:strand:- start:1624 stop:1890 length:267 start_codon:yes stop_codon:yes gene_type:complete